MAVEFLTDEQAAGYARFTAPPALAELERFCFLDDADRRLIARRRSDHARLGLAVQLGTVRFLGAFLPDPLDVPPVLVDYLAGQLGIADPSCVKQYLERRMTRFDDQREIAAAGGWTEFAAAREELTQWLDDLAWTTAAGPKAIFDAAVGWLRERQVLLPGVSTLARLVATAREAATGRLWDTLTGPLSADQTALLDGLLEVAEGFRTCLLEAWRHGPTRANGAGMVTALDRVAQISGLGLDGVDRSAVPARRLVDLARYGSAAKAPALRRHQPARRRATVLATVSHLAATSIDDALDLFDKVMTAELGGRAERAAKDDKLRRYPRLARHAARLAAAVEVLLEARDWDRPEAVSFADVWEAIETVVPAHELRDAVSGITEVTPPPDADPDGEWRARLVERYASVRGFAPLLTQVIPLGATAQAAPVLAALAELPDLLATRASKKIPASYLDARRAHLEVIPPGWWHRLVFTTGRPEGTIDRAGYVFCLLEALHTGLKRRDIFAPGSTRWTDPRAGLLDGEAWAAAKPAALNALQLPESPDALLARNAEDLDAMWRGAAAALTAAGEAEAAARLDAEGRLHAEAVTAEPEPLSLVELRGLCQAMLPDVDLPELILEVMGWHPGFAKAFATGISGGASRLDDLHLSVAAALTAHALNLDYTAVIDPNVSALTRGRISHVDQNYLRPETYAAANAVLIAAQAEIPLAQAWGGGLVAAVDGMRFIVPPRSAHAGANPKYFGRRRGVTWLNAINDRAAGIAGKVLTGTPRDSLHMVDLLYARDGGPKPEVVITDTGSYSDLVFGLLRLLGYDYRPALADLPDAKLWRINPSADYGPLQATARGRIDIGRIRAHWPDLLRVAASVHNGAISAHDALTAMARGSTLSDLGQALAHYGRIFKTCHVLTYLDDEPYRRDIKGMRNLQEGRHDLARHVFHGRKGELHEPYRDGQEDHLGALGLVLNAVVLWNTVYLDAVLDHLRADGHPVLETDVARLSAYMRKHIRVHGHYFFHQPDPGRRRPLRDPTADDDAA